MSDQYDDDLRNFLENYVKPDKELASTVLEDIEKKNYFKKDPDIENFETALDVTKDLKKLMERVEALEVLNYGLWLMLEKKGFTDEEYNEALVEAKTNLLAKYTQKKETIECPKCGKLLQSADVFGIKCIYCGYEQVANPYMIKKESAEEPQVPAEEEAYDVTKDLNFDEE